MSTPTMIFRGWFPIRKVHQLATGPLVRVYRGPRSLLLLSCGRGLEKAGLVPHRPGHQGRGSRQLRASRPQHHLSTPAVISAVLKSCPSRPSRDRHPVRLPVVSGCLTPEASGCDLRTPSRHSRRESTTSSGACLVLLGGHVLVSAALRQRAAWRQPKERLGDDADLTDLAPSRLASWKIRCSAS
jgi:hypothetical protein